jgi:hypothetical protein
MPPKPHGLPKPNPLDFAIVPRSVGLPPKLNDKESRALKRAIAPDPESIPPELDQNFEMACRLAVSEFIKDALIVRNPEMKVRPKSLETILVRARKLADAMESLNLNEKMLVGKFATRRFLRSERSTPLAEAARMFSPTGEFGAFLSDVQLGLEAAKEARARGGRLPAFAERSLAHNIGLAVSLFLLNGRKPPPLSRRGLFAGALTWALDAATARDRSLMKAHQSNQGRRDVMDLMRSARRGLTDESSAPFQAAIQRMVKAEIESTSAAQSEK